MFLRGLRFVPEMIFGTPFPQTTNMVVMTGVDGGDNGGVCWYCCSDEVCGINDSGDSGRGVVVLATVVTVAGLWWY